MSLQQKRVEEKRGWVRQREMMLDGLTSGHGDTSISEMIDCA